ncbi:MAG TPA: methionyl-tRNA formyltransferase [Patescibacteria group bacterium]|nr:methionyl-tRNA formyltransferase [Patescibacteria group bacterium]
MTAGPAPGRAADPARTLFFGSGSFAVPVLDAVLADPRLELVGIVTVPDRPAGRGRTPLPTPVALRARAMWVPLLQPARVRDPEVIAEIAALSPDLGVLADYGKIVPGEVLRLPSHGFLNVHPSLLPRHRGASPIQATIAGGDPQAGVTIMHMDEGLDTGPIVATTAWPTSGAETAPELEARAAKEGAALLTATLGDWLAGSMRPRPQPEDGATLTRRLRRADALLDPARPATELERQVRAQLPWPGSAIETTAGRLTVQRASVAPAEGGDDRGTLLAHGDGLALATGDGRLVLDEVQLAGRRQLPGAEFLRGQRELLGTKVGATATRTAAPRDKGATVDPVGAKP